MSILPQSQKWKCLFYSTERVYDDSSLKKKYKRAVLLYIYTYILAVSRAVRFSSWFNQNWAKRCPSKEKKIYSQTSSGYGLTILSCFSKLDFTSHKIINSFYNYIAWDSKIGFEVIIVIHTKYFLHFLLSVVYLCFPPILAFVYFYEFCIFEKSTVDFFFFFFGLMDHGPGKAWETCRTTRTHQKKGEARQCFVVFYCCFLL